MKRKRVIIHKVQIDLDPRFAAEHPHDWRLCGTCGSLIPNRCSECGLVHAQRQTQPYRPRGTSQVRQATVTVPVQEATRLRGLQ